tara:strand:+ start:159 stop:863 length:705 start_codon:yes stop_codon:yes gene_type:complete
MTHGIDTQNLFPTHVAFIMDGNRRWAKKNKLPIVDGHKKGAEIIKKIVRKSIKLNIKYLTFYGFSSENWNRSRDEVIQLQSLLKHYLDSEKDNFLNNKINFSFIGDIDKFGPQIINKLNSLKKSTKNFNKLFFTLALGYGSRGEILAAINKVLKKKRNNITERNISENLMTNHLPEPDLVIRTSGEKRLSNFLLWQIAYSELYFTKTQWPDFDVNRYMIALKDFINRKRRYGGD